MLTSTNAMPTLISGNGDGFGGGSGAWVAILALALLGNRGGWGGGGCGGDSGAEINGRFDALESQVLNLGDRQDLARNLEETCKVNMNVVEQAFDLSKQIAQSSFDNAIIAKDAELRAAECCCQTNNNIQAAKQEILDKLSTNEIKALEKEIARLERQIPTPSYITYPAGTAYFPPTPAVAAGYNYGSCCGGF